MTTATKRQSARRSREESRTAIIAAATELIREHGYGELSVGEVMERAGIGRTIFYRHFDDLGDLLLRASREAFESLLEAELDLESARGGSDEATVRAALAPAVDVHERHGPLLRALAEAAHEDERVAAARVAMLQRFDELVRRWLGTIPALADRRPEELAELAHALNLLNVSYLLDAFGGTPRVSAEAALETLCGIWIAVIRSPRPDGRG